MSRLILRSGWGATPSPTPPRLTAWRSWVAHWRDSATVGNTGGALLMRNAERYHEETKGWRDIAYHAGIDRAGNVYQGRDLGRQGGATSGRNHDTMALVFLFGVGELTPAALSAARWLIHEHAPQLGWPFVGIQPHSHYRRTECPGYEIRDTLDQIGAPMLDETTAPTPTTVALDLAGVIAYVDLVYQQQGREAGEDLSGRRYWVETAAASPDPWAVMETMLALFAAEGNS